jgi:phosphomannomutase|tara:strand:+ start:1000 stop:1722 length:723 start_codon:yes stop_codon:yes gene_type:complete
MFIFDVDGTLTPSRQKIDPDFKQWFTENIHDYCFVTGSDKEKTIEQVGLDMFVGAKYSFQCNGNDVYFYGKHIESNEWTLPSNAKRWLNEQLEESNFPLRTGLHIEHRPGMVNFSIVGRNATHSERGLYVKYDKASDERTLIAEMFNSKFTKLEAKAGGETGIDIGPKGADKSQILKFVLDLDGTLTMFNEKLKFYGDRMDEAGNDYPLAKVILDNSHGTCYNVEDYKDTWTLLKAHIND